MKGDRKRYHTASIDGQTVKIGRGETILGACRKAGIYIPTLCFLDNLEPYGGCRLCAVEVKGMKGFPTSCTTPIAPGMEILTNTPELRKLRKEILEFTLSEHPFTCLVCKDRKACTDFMHTTRKVSTITGCNFCTSNGDCELQELVDRLDLDSMKFPVTYRGIPPVKDNPFYDLDYNLCVLCGRCVRICNEERNSHVLAFVERGNTTIVGTAFNESQAEAGCEFCGACVDVCPTGSISEKMGKWRGVPDHSVNTTCTICQVACDMNVNSRNGSIVQIGAKPGKRTGPPQLCVRGKFLPRHLNDHPSRITAPLIKKRERWVETSWEEALGYTAARLKEQQGARFGLIASAQDTLEDNYILQKFSRKVMRSNHVDLHASYPARELPAQIHHFMVLHPPPGLDEIEKARTLLVIGLDGSASHPLLENRIRKAFRGGRDVIYAAPFSTRTSTFVNHEIHYRPGEEEHFIRSLVSVLAGHPAAAKKKDQAAPGSMDPELGKAAARLLDSKEVVIIPGDDLLRCASAREVLQALFSLHGILSVKGKCSILFSGYEGNLYSGALAGLHPDYLPGFQPVKDKKNIEWWNRAWDARLSSTRGFSCNQMTGGDSGTGVSSLMLIGDLPSDRGLDGLDFIVQCNMFLTSVSKYADVVLPVTDFLENDGHVLSMDGRLKRVNRALQPPGSTKSMSGIISGLASAMGESGFSSRPAQIYREMNSAFQLRGRSAGTGSSGEISSGSERTRPAPKGKANGYPVSLMIRHDHFRYRGNCLGDFITDLETVTNGSSVGLADSLMDELGLVEGDHVRIVSACGAVDSLARLLPGLDGHSACLLQHGNGASGIHQGFYPEKSVMDVRIEKLK
jgi:formate dehydrogenase alpha subunit